MSRNETAEGAHGRQEVKERIAGSRKSTQKGLETREQASRSGQPKALLTGEPEEGILRGDDVEPSEASSS